MVEEDLTARQQEAVVAVFLEGMPISEVAKRMGTNQYALYKLLHDARRKLKREGCGLLATRSAGCIRGGVRSEGYGESSS
jgi:DNA-directed RNA polymerase specialized sigma24 family protein